MIKIKIKDSIHSEMSINKSVMVSVLPTIGSQILIDSLTFIVETIIFDLDNQEIKVIVKYNN